MVNTNPGSVVFMLTTHAINESEENCMSV